MRGLKLVFGGIVGLSAILTAAACSDSSNGAPGSGDDGGADAKTDAKPRLDGSTDDDAGVTFPPPSGKALATGSVFLIGVTTGGDAVFLAATSATAADLLALPITGGTPTTIASNVSIDNDVQVLRGNTVLYWSAVNATSQVGTLNLWTRAGGAKLGVATGSLAGFGAASTDGAKVLFTANATLASGKPTLAEFGYVNAADAGANAPTVLKTTDQLNVAAAAAPANGAASCAPTVRFGGTTAFVAYCAGTDAAEKKARITQITDPATAQRLDAASGDGTVQPLLGVDATGATVLGITLAPDENAIVFKKGVTSGTALTADGKADSGFVIANGDATIFHAGTAVLQYTTTGAPTGRKNLVASAKPVKSMPRISGDLNHLLVSYLDPVSKSGVNLFDLHAIDSTAAAAVDQTPTDLVTAAGAFSIAFLADNTTVAYVDELGTTGGKAKVKSVTGGAEKVLQADAAGIRVSPGKGVLVFTNGQTGQTTQATIFDATWSKDAAAGVTAEPLETNVVPSTVFFSGTKAVYQRDGDPNADGFGIFTIDLPQ